MKVIFLDKDGVLNSDESKDVEQIVERLGRKKQKDEGELER